MAYEGAREYIRSGEPSMSCIERGEEIHNFGGDTKTELRSSLE